MVTNTAFVSLVKGIKQIQTSSTSNLRDVEYLVKIINDIGLAYDARGVYGRDQIYMNESEQGLWQIPQQIAECLVFLSNFEINSFIEIGTYTGWTASLITSYLERFNPCLKAVSIDVGNFFEAYDSVKSLIPLSYEHKTSNSFRRQAFDLCFIDGDHSYAWCKKDYENVGKYANICMFHDINDKNVYEFKPNKGGVRRFWESLKKQEEQVSQFEDFLYHSENDKIMGIGLRVKLRNSGRWDWLGRWI